MNATKNAPLECKNCRHWRRLREEAVVGQCKISDSRAFSHENSGCASWTGHTASAIDAATRRLTLAKATIGFVAAELLAQSTDIASLSSCVLG